MLALVGLEPERRYVESHGDGNAIAKELVRGGDRDSSGYSSKDGALSAIGSFLSGVFEAQKDGIATANDAIEEPKTHHDPTSLEQLAQSAAAIALSATAGFLGNLAASKISGYLTRHQGLSGASALSPGWQASVDGAKDGVKELYKQSLQFGLSDAKSPRGPKGGRPADTSVQGALRTPKAIFLGLQREAIRSASSKAAEGLGKAHEQLAHQDLTTLSAVAAALEEIVEQAADAQARHTLVEWMNFKARWHASNHLEKGSRRDANLSHLDRRQLLTSPEGFLTVWARVDGALTDRSVACQRMKLGGLDDEESVARWFKQSGMVVGEPRMNVMVRVLSNDAASAREVILWRRPDHRLVDIQHCSVAGLAWLKAFAAGKTYSRSSFAAGFPWSNADEIANLNRIYDDFHAQRAAETIVGAILTEPLSELEM